MKLIRVIADVNMEITTSTLLTIAKLDFHTSVTAED